MFPPKEGVSDTLSPETMYMGQKNIAFGSYDMAHIGTRKK